MNNLPTSNPSETKNEIVVYQPDETVRLDVRLEENTVWLTQNQMTDLFQRDRSVITRHINNVFAEGELDEQSNVHFLHIAISDKPVKMYSLNVIMSGGYRGKSLRGKTARRNRVALMALRRRSSCCATTPRLTPYAIFIALLTCESVDSACFVAAAIYDRASIPTYINQGVRRSATDKQSPLHW